MVVAVLAHGDVIANGVPQLSIDGSGSRGVFDPAVTEDPETGRLWMSYSSFDVSKHSRWGVGVSIAYSDDGETWRNAGAVQAFADVTVGPLGATEAGESAVDADSRGTWQNETSTLVYDGHAPAEQRWKLFWHQSLWVNDVPRYPSYSWIALKMADTPENLARPRRSNYSPATWLGPRPSRRERPLSRHFLSRQPFNSIGRDAQLGACVFGQPAAISARDGLYLALDCAWLGSRPGLHTVLLRCAYPGCSVTDSASWTVVGRLTEPRDGPWLDEQYKGFGGTAFAEKDGRYI